MTKPFIADTATLRTWVEILHGVAKEDFSRRGEMVPHLLVMHAKRWSDGSERESVERIVALSLPDLDADKDRAYLLALTLAAAVDVDACCLLSDCWMLTTRDEAEIQAYVTSGRPLSEHPSAIESMLTMGYARGLSPIGIRSGYQRKLGGLPRDFQDEPLESAAGIEVRGQLDSICEPLPEALPDMVRWAAQELLRFLALSVVPPIPVDRSCGSSWRFRLFPPTPVGERQ